MAGIKEALQSALKNAMKSRDQIALDALRMTNAAIKNKEIEKKVELSEAEITQVISTMCKQRRESAEEFRKGNRIELAEKEETELKVLGAFLPPQLSEADVESEVKAAIESLGAKDMKDMGKVIKSLRDKLAGQVDGKLLSDTVRRMLS
jgi:uncharacterized protein